MEVVAEVSAAVVEVVAVVLVVAAEVVVGVVVAVAARRNAGCRESRIRSAPAGVSSGCRSVSFMPGD